MKHVCRICSNPADNTEWLCRENMFGWGDQFTYFQCAQCNALQITKSPENPGHYYPPDYYSFQTESLTHNTVKSWFAARRDRSAATGTGVLGRSLAVFFQAREDVTGIAQVPGRPDMHILDVGCGRGQLLRILRRAGFKHLTGIDPFLTHEPEIEPGLLVRKCELKDLNDTYDLIMFHHVFEHLESPQKALADCARRLAPGGRILLRFPTVESQAWETYRENWAQLDAPRHLFLHTRKSLQLLAEQTGLKIDSYRCDSSAFQFWASELYRRGIPLIPAMPGHHFSKAQMQHFSEMAAELNQAGRGDQVAAVLSLK